MKRSSLIILIGVVIGAACIYQQWLINQISIGEKSESNVRDTLSLPKEGFRPSVAFILGEDKETSNPYYQEALHYYTVHPKGKTSFVISSCRSLEEVKSYLAEQAIRNAQPWGEIHLVSHGNQWNGLSVKVALDSKRATTQRINESTQKEGFEFLPPGAVDDLTRIFIHSCGVGNDEQLIDAIQMYLSSTQNAPTVYAPRLFEFYSSDAGGKNPQKYLAENWMIDYRFGERPSSFVLMNELREKYSDVPIDWQGALQRDKPRWIGDSYHYTFDVPVKWIIPVDSAINLDQEEQQMQWLSNQHEIVNELKRLNLPLEKFKWTFSKGYAEDKEGGRNPAISVKGYCTMLCVVKALIPDSTKNTATSDAIVPEITDFRYYYKTTPALLATINKNIQ